MGEAGTLHGATLALGLGCRDAEGDLMAAGAHVLPHTSKVSWQISDNVPELSPCLEPCIVLQSMKTMAAASLMPSQSHTTLLLWLMLALNLASILKHRSCSAESTWYKATACPTGPGIKSARKAEREKDTATVSLLSLVPVSFIRKAAFPEVPS